MRNPSWILKYNGRFQHKTKFKLIVQLFDIHNGIITTPGSSSLAVDIGNSESQVLSKQISVEDRQAYSICREIT